MRILTGFTFVLLLPAAVVANDDPSMATTMGLWATQGFGSTVLLEPCEPDVVPVELCGTITWVWDVEDESLIGTRILSGFRRGDDGAWRGGRVFNPDDGRTYSGTIRPQTDDTLELKGCALRIFCQTRTWRRAVSVCGVGGPLDAVLFQ